MENKIILLASGRSVTKRAGYGASSGLLVRDADPDPYQNVSDPEHWFSE
jgi:hypothetical protein